MKLNLKTKKILVVEDHAIIREAIKHMLYGLEARHIFDLATGTAAIGAMKNRAFDIVICDYHLGPGKNGQQLLEEARHNKLLPFHAIFIMVTVEQQQGMVLSALDNKPDEYLTKPFNAQQLLSRLQRSFNRKQYFHEIGQEISNGNTYLAIEHCMHLLEQGDKNMRLQLLKIRAELAIEIGDLDYAQSVYQNVLKERDLTWARLGLGIVAYLRGHFEQAIGYFQQLIEFYPAMLDAYDWLTKTYETTNNIPSALEIMETAVSLSPQAILRQQKLAALASQTTQIETAQKAFKTAIKLGKYSVHKSSKDYSGLAKLYLKTNATQQAQQLLEDLHQQFINEPEAELQATLLGIELYHSTGQNTLARQAYEDAINLCNHYGRLTSKELRLQMAKTCFQNNDIGMAESIINDLVKSNIENKFFLEDVKQLCNTFNRDGFIDTLVKNTKQQLVDINNAGVNLFKKGRLKEALATFQDATEIMPDNKTIVLNIAKILIHDLKVSGPTAKKLNKAQSHLNKAVELGVSHDKLSSLQTEMAKIHHDYLSKQPKQ